MSRFYPSQTDIGSIDRLERVIKDVYGRIYNNTDELAGKIKSVGDVAAKAAISATPTVIREALQSNGSTPISIQGLPGVAAQPQFASIPEVGTLPSDSSPLAQNTGVVRYNGTIWVYNSTTGAWTQLGAKAYVQQGTYANRPSVTTVDNGLLYEATDQNTLYVVVAGAWTWLAGLMFGDTASRPVLAAGDVRFRYFDTTLVSEIYWDGAAWVEFLPDASLTKRGAVSTGAQSFAGVKTFVANPVVTNTAPGMTFTDTTAAAKSLTLAVDANVAELRESAGAAGSLLVLDLANATLGIGETSSAKVGINGGLHVGGTSDPGDNNAAVDGYLTVADEAYGAGWNGSLQVPTKNAVYDKIESLPPSGSVLTSVVTSQFDKTNDATLANCGLTVNVLNGVTYSFQAALHVTADAVAGHKYGFGGTASTSSFIAQIDSIDNGANGFVINSRSASIGASTGESTSGATTVFTTMNGYFVCSGDGTFTIQFAENTATAATVSSVLVGSSLNVMAV